MNYKIKRLRKVKTNFNFSLLLISLLAVWNFCLLSAEGEDFEILALNASRDRLASVNEISSAAKSSSGWESPQASGFRLKEGSPSPRIFTPNGDGSNEKVIFRYENDDASSIVCWIYSITGAVVRQLDIVETGENEFSWNGKDEDGNLVSSGVYIYQIEAGGKTINGTIVLAK